LIFLLRPLNQFCISLIPNALSWHCFYLNWISKRCHVPNNGCIKSVQKNSSLCFLLSTWRAFYWCNGEIYLKWGQWLEPHTLGSKAFISHLLHEGIGYIIKRFDLLVVTFESMFLCINLLTIANFILVWYPMLYHDIAFIWIEFLQDVMFLTMDVSNMSNKIHCFASF